MEMSADTRAILGLQLPTDPRWVDLAALSLGEILTDHAYCEQKAATTCISLIQRYSQYEELVSALAPIVTEEWGHFRLVLAELHKRGLTLGKQRKDEYVNALLEFQQKGGDLQTRMLDQLLTMALIEARSCERFKRLSEGLEDPYLKKFYRRFMESEAGHYTLFIELAEKYMDPVRVKNRWKEWLEYEKEVIGKLEIRGDRIH
jgi:tRNA-(ms[2]io[6]A)-hydroxylase